ncbi:MAG: molybdopterin-guanine dinucleotide biosynthesis protein B [Lachnospiraceae bacterium]|nr:molybdopterin-guanine dinucleotide biosynthesis protein B [Lachnospiraceae bacterium]
MQKYRNQIITSFVGYSGSGKTTFIEKLIKELKSRGRSVAVIKHDAHKFDIDKEGKDTFRYKQAGAGFVSIFSKNNYAVVSSYGTEKIGLAKLDELINMAEGSDVVIVEGCRESSIPKIGVSRVATGKGLSVDVKNLAALITDDDNLKHPVRFGFDDEKAVADWLLDESFAESGSNDDFSRGVSVEKAFEIIESIPLEPETEYVDINEAFGRVSAENCLSEMDFPPFRRSPLDGYAFNHEDTKGADREHPVTFKIVEEIPAGKSPEHALKKGEAAKILTGAPLPENADVVEKFEVCTVKDDLLTITREYEADTNVVPIGEDYHKGELLIEKGNRIGPFEAGLLAMLGYASVNVYRKPVAAVLSTGSELVDADEPELPNGKIRNSSIYTIGAMAEEAGAKAVNYGIVSDDEKEIAKAIIKASGTSDIVFTTGGVSVGDYDLVISALKMIGAEILFWKVSMKPGMAFVAAVYNGRPVIGLSGNPSAAAMSMTMFGKTLIRRLEGVCRPLPVISKMKLGEDIKKKSPGGRFIRGRVIIENGEAIFLPNKIAGNGTTKANAKSDSVGIIKPGQQPLAGELIEVIYERQL